MKMTKDIQGGSQRRLDHIRKEQMVMASVVHRLGYELYSQQFQN